MRRLGTGYITSPQEGATFIMNKQVRALLGAAAAAAMVIGQSLAPAAAATTTWTITPGGNAATSAASWSVQLSPNVRPYSNLLEGVAATSMSNAWAVGESFNASTGRTLIEHWDGQRWAVQPSPNASSADGLAGVAATSASSAWAVGSHSPSAGPYRPRTLIEHWNGRRWAVQPSPNMSSRVNDLTGVAATSASNAWAVGYFFKGSAVQALIEHWDGQRWAIQPTPSLGTNTQLWDVAATSASNAWAVGDYQKGTAQDRTFIEHWNGQRWAIQPSPSMGSQANDLYGVAATSASNAWAVGGTLIEHWNGRTWAVQSSLNVDGHPDLDGVAATSASNAWAVGSYSNPVGTAPRTLIEHWNGQRWAIQPSPSVGSQANELYGVAATAASNAWAVGSYPTRMHRTLILNHH
jgi:hypothetical protein